MNKADTVEGRKKGESAREGGDVETEANNKEQPQILEYYIHHRPLFINKQIMLRVASPEPACPVIMPE